MNLLHSHIEQIAQSSAAIADLPFSTPRPFTNALLRTADITSLIRDTEAHERALFTLPSQPSNSSHRKSIYAAPSTQTYGSSTLRTRTGNHPTVRRILGGDLLERIRAAEAAAAAAGDVSAGRPGKVDVDVSALLDGAEKLCDVYPIAGARARIATLRSRYQVVAASVERYEAIVEGQARELERVTGRMERKQDDGRKFADSQPLDDSGGFTREDLAREEAEIKELEERRRLLEQRVYGMERDLGALE